MQKYEQLVQLYQKASGSLNMSVVEEPMPYAVVESILMRTIPISSRVGGVLEIVKGTSLEQFAYSPADVDAIVDRVDLLLSLSKEENFEIADKGREHILNLFEKEKTEKMLLKTFMG